MNGLTWDAAMRADAERRFLEEARFTTDRKLPVHASGPGGWPRCGAQPEFGPDGSSEGVLVGPERFVTCPVCIEQGPEEPEPPVPVERVVALVDDLAGVLRKLDADVLAMGQRDEVMRVLARYDAWKRSRG